MHINPLDTMAAGLVRGMDNNFFYKLMQKDWSQLCRSGVLPHDLQKALDINGLGFDSGYNGLQILCWSIGISVEWPDSVAVKTRKNWLPAVTLEASFERLKERCRLVKERIAD